MSRQPLVILGFFVLAAVLWWVYESYRIPPGIVVKGPQNWTPWVSLVGAIISLITGFVTLALKLIEFRQRKSQPCVTSSSRRRRT
jgi:hypothetical protein